MAQPQEILHTPYEVQHRYVDSLYKSTRDLDPQRRIDVMKLYRGWAENNKDYPLAYELQLKECFTEVNAAKSESGALEQKMLEIAIAARDRGLPAIEAGARQLMANYWVIFHKYSLAFENYREAYNIYSKLPVARFPQKRSYVFELGGIYYRYEDNNTALKYLKEALNTPAANGSLDNTINNTIGLCFRRMKQYDSAEQYFLLVYNNAKNKRDTAWEGIATGNIGITYFHRGKYEEAMPLIEKDISLSRKTNQIRNAAEAMMMLAAIHAEYGHLAEAKKVLMEALQMCQSRPFWPDYYLAEKLYRQLYKAYAADNDMRMAFLYADSTLMAKDTNAARHNVENLERARDRVEFMQKKLEAEQLAGQKQVQLMIRNSLILAIVLLCAIGILAINRQRLRQKKLLAEKLVAEKELDHAGAQLDGFKRSVQEKNNMLEQFAAELEKMKQGQTQKTETDLLTELEQATILTDEQWEHFRQVFEKVHSGFFANLKKKIPDLTPSEIRFLALTKLKLSSKEMASMLGISSNAIRIYRHRLRSKLGLNKEDTIEDLVEKI